MQTHEKPVERSPGGAFCDSHGNKRPKNAANSKRSVKDALNDVSTSHAAGPGIPSGIGSASSISEESEAGKDYKKRRAEAE